MIAGLIRRWRQWRCPHTETHFGSLWGSSRCPRCGWVSPGFHHEGEAADKYDAPFPRHAPVPQMPRRRAEHRGAFAHPGLRSVGVQHVWPYLQDTYRP